MAERRMLFIPMYNCAPQIPRVLGQLGPALQQEFDEIFVLDNGSTDGGPEAAREAGEELQHTRVLVARNQDNYGLGGSHKVAFQRCLDEGYDAMVVFHGDDQGRLDDLMRQLPKHPEAECVLGSRFMRGSQLVGYAPHRILANLAFNAIFSAMSRRVLWDLGSGLNLYRRRFVERRLWEGCAEDLTFNYHLILRSAAVPELGIDFVPISWREEDQISNAKLGKHGLTMLGIVRDHTRARQQFLHSDFSTHPGPRSYRVLWEST